MPLIIVDEPPTGVAGNVVRTLGGAEVVQGDRCGLVGCGSDVAMVRHPLGGHERRMPTDLALHGCAAQPAVVVHAGEAEVGHLHCPLSSTVTVYLAFRLSQEYRFVNMNQQKHKHQAV